MVIGWWFNGVGRGGLLGGQREGKVRGIRGEGANSVPQFKGSRYDI